MTAIVPTAIAIKLKFPEFAGLADQTIEFAIEEAQLTVTDNSGWVNDANQTMALMYLAGHYLMVTLSRAESGAGSRLRSESMDGMSKTYDLEGTIPDSGDYNTTTYGSRFLDLVKFNFPAIAVI